MTPEKNWAIPKPIWWVLVSWGLAVLMIAGLLSWWIRSNELDQSHQNELARLESDRAMCVMLELFVSGPEPVAGAAGDRGRAVLAAMRAYEATLHCDAIGPPD